MILPSQLISLNLERAFLGGLIKKPNTYYQLDGFIGEADFHESFHSKIFSIIKQLLVSQSNIDGIIVSQKVKDIGIDKVHDIPIFQYIDDITFTQINEKGIIDAAKELSKLRIRRELFRNAEDVKKFLVDNGNKPVNDIVAGVDRLYNNQVKEYEGDEEPVDLFSEAEDLIRGIAENPKEESGLITPFKHFNNLFGGLRAGSGIYNIVARAGESKSTFLFNMGTGVAKLNNCKILYLDNEMDANTNTFRACAAESGCPMWHLETGQWAKNLELSHKVNDSFGRLNKMKGLVFHKNTAGNSIHEIISIAKRWYFKYVGRGNKCMIVYDYLKITGGESDNRKEYQEMGDIVTYLNELGNTLNCPIWTATQQNRSAEEKDGRRDDSTTGAISDRINWLVAFNAVFRRKTLEEIQDFGPQFGTHLLRPFKTRFQGKDAYGHNSWIRVVDQLTNKITYKQNFINYNVESFKVDEKETYREIIQYKNLNKDLQHKDGEDKLDL